MIIRLRRKYIRINVQYYIILRIQNKIVTSNIPTRHPIYRSINSKISENQNLCFAFRTLYPFCSTHQPLNPSSPHSLVNSTPSPAYLREQARAMPSSTSSSVCISTQPLPLLLTTRMVVPFVAFRSKFTRITSPACNCG